MFIRSDNGNLRMITAIEAPVDNSSLKGKCSWDVVVRLGIDEEIRHFREDETQAWEFFNYVSREMAMNRVLTLSEAAWERPPTARKDWQNRIRVMGDLPS